MSAMFHLENFGGIDLYRPRRENELLWSARAAAQMRSLFAAGEYTDANTINAVLKSQFQFYAAQLEKVIPQLASLQYMAFLLHQYDQASLIDETIEGLGEPKRAQWRELERVFRRTAKFLCETMTLLQPGEAPDLATGDLVALTDEAWIAAEEMVKLYLASDQTFCVFPQDTVLEIHPEGQGHFDLRINRDCPFQTVSGRDFAHRGRFVGQQSAAYDYLHAEHDKHLGPPLRQAIGLTYEETVNLLRDIVESCRGGRGFGIPFVPRRRVVDVWSNALGKPAATVDKVLAGFALRKADMEKEGREIYKPKQEYRAFRRALFEILHSSGDHLFFSKRMAVENREQLIGGACFKQFPPQWRSPEVDKALEALSNAAGDWFEAVVERNLANIGIRGLRSVHRVGQGSAGIVVPPDVGEIDFLGYSRSQRLLVLVECKMVRYSFEGKLYRDDLQEFVTGTKSYLSRFLKKVEWVRANVKPICAALDSSGLPGGQVSPSRLAAAMITYYPNIAQFFIDECPCVSLTNFMLDFEEAGGWPYLKGVTEL